VFSEPEFDPTMTMLCTVRTLRNHWPRLWLHVRCGLQPAQPARIWQYLACGNKLARLGAIDEITVQTRMLNTLLQASRDEELPWFWRSVCLEHVTHPLARLCSLVGTHDPLALQAIEAAVQSCRDALPPPPRQPATGVDRRRGSA